MTTNLITTLEAQYAREFNFLSEIRSHTGRSFVDGLKKNCSEIQNLKLLLTL